MAWCAGRQLWVCLAAPCRRIAQHVRLATGAPRLWHRSVGCNKNCFPCALTASLPRACAPCRTHKACTQVAPLAAPLAAHTCSLSPRAPSTRPAAYTAICASVAPERCSTTSVPSSHRNTATPSSAPRRLAELPLGATAAVAEPPLPATAAVAEPPLLATVPEEPWSRSTVEGRSPARRTFLEANVWRPTLSTA